jgi:hypothetical protein
MILQFPRGLTNQATIQAEMLGTSVILLLMIVKAYQVLVKFRTKETAKFQRWIVADQMIMERRVNDKVVTAAIASIFGVTLMGAFTVHTELLQTWIIFCTKHTIPNIIGPLESAIFFQTKFIQTTIRISLVI